MYSQIKKNKFVSMKLKMKKSMRDMRRIEGCFEVAFMSF